MWPDNMRGREKLAKLVNMFLRTPGNELDFCALLISGAHAYNTVKWLVGPLINEQACKKMES